MKEGICLKCSLRDKCEQQIIRGSKFRFVDSQSGFREICNKLVVKGGESFTVSWECFAQHYGSNRHLDDIGKMCDILHALGIFAFSDAGNWEIIGSDGECLNPRSRGGGSILYFTSRESVEGFARKKYGTAYWPWRIRRIAEVIEKEEIV